MKREKTIALGAIATSVLIAAAIGLRVWTGPDPDTVPSDTATMQNMEGMAGMESMAGMDMDTGDQGSIRLDPGDLTTFGITFETVELRPLTRTVRAVGVIEADETRTAYVAPRFGGWAERLHVGFTGATVQAGQPLVDVYAPELVAAQEELLLAARMLDSLGDSRVEEVGRATRRLYEAARRRLDYWDISAEQIDGIVASGEVREALTLYAPISGVVVEKAVRAGEAFEAGANLYMLADLSRVWLNAEIFEQDAGLVQPGMPVEIDVAALPGRSFEGRIDYVYPTLREDTRSLSARVTLSNASGVLKPGMYATVRAEAVLGDVLTVPTSAVLRTGERAVAFADMGGGELMPYEIDLGVAGDQFVQVLSGLEPGQRVVTSAQFLLDSESNLAEVMRAMMAQMNLSDMGSMDMGGMDMGSGGQAGPTDSTGGR